MPTFRRHLVVFLSLSFAASSFAANLDISTGRNLCVVIGDSRNVIQFAGERDWTVFYQSPDTATITSLRKAADLAGLLGRRVFVEQASLERINLGDNIADTVIVSGNVQYEKKEVMRVLHPGGTAMIGDQMIVKPAPKETDNWSHPYHGPDNNPLSTDRAARAPYLTQFIAGPKFSPMPQVSVSAGGRIFKAFGHIAHKANQNPVLNTLMCINSYNGSIMWKRKLREGFMIHRNTMIATKDHLFMGNDESCKVIDALTGEVTREIVVPKGLGDGPTWKWMAMVDGTLYALVGAKEVSISTKPSTRAGLGHWPWAMWEGHDYKDPSKAFGYGRTFIAVDPKTGETKWHHTEKDFIDSRGTCMTDNRIFHYSPGKWLASLDVTTGKPQWKTTDKKLLEAIGPNQRAQLYKTGYSTSTYVKCNADYIFFAGPQRKRLVCASTKDGNLVWDNDNGNLQLVLRDDALYTAGREGGGAKVEYATGKELAPMPTRRACTRATGSIDSIFYRTSGGTVRIDLPSNSAQHIAPMRPPCQDGVIIANGNLFWGPWMCGCQLSLYGHISLAGSGDEQLSRESRPQLVTHGDYTNAEPLETKPGDWPDYLGNNQRTPFTKSIAQSVKKKWSFDSNGIMPTAPVTAGGLTFIGDRSGVVRAIGEDGKLKWQAYTGGAIYYPPTIANNRLYAGSADGRVYAYEATSGRLLWTYRVAPHERWIPVFGKLISTWPVAGGVVVKGDTIYAAAGIAHYDGTHVVALDAITGKSKWHNATSGSLSKKANSGVSMQGNLFIANNKLCFLGGGVYETAQYDLETGECLNKPWDDPRSQFRTAFYPYYPEYGNYMSLDFTFDDGRALSYDASYEGNKFTPLALLPALPKGEQKVRKDAARWNTRRGWSQKRKAIWQFKSPDRFAAFVVSPKTLLTTSNIGKDRFLTAIDIENGAELWQKVLPAQPIKGGIAVDRNGRIIVTLENGQVICFDQSDAK